MESVQYLRPGATLWHDTYRIERILGHGGFGVTYLAFDNNLGVRVAVKEFFPQTFCSRDKDTSRVSVSNISNAELVERLKTKFLKEAQNIARLHHPDIIRIFTSFDENGTAYYAMEYLEGDNLSERVRRRGPLPVAEALEIAGRIGAALSYIHSQKINHLDVKPANIMMKSDGTPVLIDFGLAKRYDSAGNQTSTTPVGISHGYAPFEQYNAEGVKDFSPRTDLYSLGATLYFMLTGETPPAAPNLLDSKLEFPDTIPFYLRHAILKSMSPRRDGRQETVDEFIREINNEGGDDSTRFEGEMETRVPDPPSTARETKKGASPVLVFGGIAVGIGVLLLLFFLFAGSGGNREEAVPESEFDPVEEIAPVEAPTPITIDGTADNTPTTAAYDYITDQIGYRADGSALRLSGSFYNSSNSWPVSLSFKRDSQGGVIAVFHNNHANTSGTLSVSFNGEDMLLTGSVGGQPLNMYLTVRTGGRMVGTATSGSTTLNVSLSK